jgi:hypothetical protein
MFSMTMKFNRLRYLHGRQWVKHLGLHCQRRLVDLDGLPYM